MNARETIIKVELTPEQRAAQHALEQQTFEIAFESFLEQISSGVSLERAIVQYHTHIIPARFRSWVYRDSARKQAYMVAKAIGADAVEDELIRIADGLNSDGNASPHDVARSTLMINTRKWLLGVWNRRRYGDVKHIEQTTTNRLDVSSMTTDELKRMLLKEMGMDGEDSTVFENDDLSF